MNAGQQIRKILIRISCILFIGHQMENNPFLDDVLCIIVECFLQIQCKLVDFMEVNTIRSSLVIHYNSSNKSSYVLKIYDL